MRWIWLLAFGLAALSCMQTPLMIEKIKLADGRCLSWTTNVPASCTVSWCDDSQCHFSDQGPEDTLHSYALPRCVHDIKITAKRGGEIVQAEVTP